MIAALEIFRDSVMVSRVRSNLQSAIEYGDSIEIDMNQLETNLSYFPSTPRPFASMLRSMWLDARRTRTSTLTNAGCLKNKVSMVLLSRNIGVEQRRRKTPVNKVWAGRLIIYPDEPWSGPLRHGIDMASIRSNQKRKCWECRTSACK